MLRKKQEAKEAIFEEPKTKIDLDEELQKLERIKQLRQSQMDEYRNRLNQQKLKEMTKIYFQNEQKLLKYRQ